MFGPEVASYQCGTTSSPSVVGARTARLQRGARLIYFTLL